MIVGREARPVASRYLARPRGKQVDFARGTKFAACDDSNGDVTGGLRGEASRDILNASGALSLRRPMERPAMTAAFSRRDTRRWQAATKQSRISCASRDTRESSARRVMKQNGAKHRARSRLTEVSPS
jgi:hypothetical protein